MSIIMKLSILLVLLSASMFTYASGTQSNCVLEPINGSSLGNIRYSILSEQKFQEINGKEWVLMKGQSKTDLNINNSEVSIFNHLNHGTYFNTSILPSVENGEFLRPKGSRHVLLGSSERDSTAVNGLVVNDNEEIKSAAQDGGTKTAQEAGEHKHYMAKMKKAQETEKGDDRGSWEYGHAPNKHTGDSGKHTHNIDINHSHAVDIKHNHVLKGDTETRPKNIAVNVFIKIKRRCIDRDGEQCLNMAENSSAQKRSKLSCLKREITQYELSRRAWSSGYLINAVAATKFVIMQLEAANASELNYLDYLNNNYPFYNSIRD
ncbi:MAG: hypothetical protein ISR65_07650 [Bacteriovoracaceae bacterium]|nr:hypothetical protein [Bacteriovoracaceae bacterium]